MIGHFQTKHALNDPVHVYGVPGRVVAITFRGTTVTYEIAFDNGGAIGRHDSSEVSE